MLYVLINEYNFIFSLSLEGYEISGATVGIQFDIGAALESMTHLRALS